MTVPAGLVAGLLAVVGVALLALRRPIFAAMGLRQAVQRPRQLTMIAFGLMVATAVLTGASVGADSMQASMRDSGLSAIADTDLALAGEHDTFSEALADEALASAAVAPRVASSARALVAHASAVNEATDLGEPELHVWGVDPAEMRALGALEARSGVVPASLAGWSPATILLNRHLASALDASVGDDVTIYAEDARGATAEGTYRVVAIVSNRGSDPLEPGVTAFVPRDGLQALLDQRGALTTVLVDGVPGTDLEALEARLADAAMAAAGGGAAAPPFHVRNLRAEYVEDVADESEGMAVFFLVLGTFSILAGILLIVSLLAMLIEERKADLATLRAVGARRFDITQIHVHEAALYGVAAAFLGLGAGIAFAQFIMMRFQAMLPIEGEQIGLAIDPVTLVASAGGGFALTLLVVVFAAQRIAKFNIARGLRGDDEPTRRLSWRSWLGYGALVLGGGALTLLAIQQKEVVPGVAGPSLLALGLAGLMVRKIRREIVFPIVGASLIAYMVFSFTYFTDLEGDADFQLMPLRGVLLTIAATMVLVYLNAPARAAAWVASRFRRLDPVADAAFAYAHARRTRTALTVAMMALVLVILVTSTTVFAMWTPNTEKAGGGFDVFAETRDDVGRPETWLAANPPRDGGDPLADVKRVVALPMANRGLHGATLEGELVSGWNQDMGVVGLAESFAASQRFDFLDLRADLVDGPAAMRAVLANESLVIASQWLWFGDDNDGRTPQVGDVITLRRANRDANVTVAATIETGFAGGLLAHPRLLDGLGDTGSLLFVEAAAGADPDAVAKALEAAFRPAGMDANSIKALMAEENQWMDTFLAIIRVYVGMGFVIGVASIGIVQARNVLERRREIGVMRALGAGHGQVGAVFILEAIFVVTLASIVGIAGGLLTAYASYEAEFKEEGATFRTDWGDLGVIVAVAYGVALVATWIPARRASRIPPATATRHVE